MWLPHRGLAASFARDRVACAEPGGLPRHLLQWEGLDYLDYHLSESCREIYFDCAEPEEELPVKLSVLRNLLCLVGREASPERTIRAA